MKQKLIQILLLLMSTTACYGGWLSFLSLTPQKKIKIAKREILELRLRTHKTTNIDIEILNAMKFFENFADKEFNENDIEKTLDATFNDFWQKHVLPEAQKHVSNEQFEENKEKQYENFKQEYSGLKPLLLQTLCEEAPPAFA